MVRIAILTISDRGASGEREDRSGPLIAQMIGDRSNWQVAHQSVVSDEVDLIANQLREWVREGVDLILTSGGTGFAPRDVTPEATRLVIEREAPGIAEALRAESLKVTRHAMLSRGVAGISGHTLIINLPGNPKAVRENMAVLFPVLPHALELLGGSSTAEAGHRTV